VEARTRACKFNGGGACALVDVFAPATGYDGNPHTCVAAGMPITVGASDLFVSVNGFVD
jgi:hypothetical protein